MHVCVEGGESEDKARCLARILQPTLGSKTLGYRNNLAKVDLHPIVLGSRAGHSS